MPLYIIEIPGSEFTGFKGGVDFHQGRGSTSSRADARRLAGLGFVVSEPGTRTIAQAGEGGTPPSPVDFTPTPEEAALDKARADALEKAEAMENDPDSEWSKKRKARADDKAHRGNRGRRR